MRGQRVADPNVGEWFVYAGMAVGGVVAALMARAGFKKGGGPKPGERDLVFSGQAAITDMGPLRELVKQVDLLALKLMAATTAVTGMTEQQARAAAALEGIAVMIRQHLEDL